MAHLWRPCRWSVFVVIGLVGSFAFWFSSSVTNTVSQCSLSFPVVTRSLSFVFGVSFPACPAPFIPASGCRGVLPFEGAAAWLELGSMDTVAFDTVPLIFVLFRGSDCR